MDYPRPRAQEAPAAANSQAMTARHRGQLIALYGAGGGGSCEGTALRPDPGTRDERANRRGASCGAARTGDAHPRHRKALGSRAGQKISARLTWSSLRGRGGLAIVVSSTGVEKKRAADVSGNGRTRETVDVARQRSPEGEDALSMRARSSAGQVSRLDP